MLVFTHIVSDSFGNDAGYLCVDISLLSPHSAVVPAHRWLVIFWYFDIVDVHLVEYRIHIHCWTVCRIKNWIFLLKLPVIGMDTEDIRVIRSHLNTFSQSNGVSALIYDDRPEPHLLFIPFLAVALVGCRDFRYWFLQNVWCDSNVGVGLLCQLAIRKLF